MDVFIYVCVTKQETFRGDFYMDTFELSDEQLEQVTGGSGNGVLQLNPAVAPTANISVFNHGDLTQSDATVLQGNSGSQTAVAWAQN
jgi:hypothetical protein